MAGILAEFKAFALRGNVVDLAVGVIIGAAFGRIVNSLVEDIIMPPIGKLVGNMDFTNLYYPLYKADTYAKTLVDAKKAGSVIAYGNFITITINFLIIAFCIFAIVKLINTAARKPEAVDAAPPAPTRDQELLAEIRDSLRNRS